MKRYSFLLISILVLLCGFGGQSAFAALSATISLVTPTVTVNQPVYGSVAVLNTGSAVNVLAFKPTASATGNSVYSPIAAAFSTFNAGPNSSSIVIAANQTTTLTFQAVFFGPSTGTANTNLGPGTFSLGALINTSDGSVFAPGAAALLTVNPLPLPASQQ